MIAWSLARSASSRDLLSRSSRSWRFCSVMSRVPKDGSPSRKVSLDDVLAVLKRSEDVATWRPRAPRKSVKPSQASSSPWS